MGLLQVVVIAIRLTVTVGVGVLGYKVCQNREQLVMELADKAHSHRLGVQTGAPDASSCVVCEEAPRTVALLPCGHTVLCAGCLAGMLNNAEAGGTQLSCPMCRAEVMDLVRGLILS
jgi:hypothetical protein